jgi:hypothetical protein
MTMQQGGGQQPLTPAPPPGYWTIQCTYASQLKSNRAGLEQAAEEWVKYQFKVGVAALIRREPNPEKRLAAYRAKPQQLWAEQRAKFPDLGEWWDFRHMVEDWTRLAPIDPVRDEVIRYVVEVELERELQGLTEGL